MLEVYGQGLGKVPHEYYRLMEFDSLYELAEYANGNETKWKSARFEPHYNLTQTYEEAHALAMDGWHDIRGKVDGYLEPLREQLGEILAPKNERVFDLCGYEPDIDRYLAGELECMVDDWIVEAPKDGKVFRMLVDVSMTWGNSSESISKRGAALCALVEAYIMLGYQLEVWTEFTVKGSTGRGYASALVPITKAGDPLDIDALMFCIGHPDFGRRLLWSWGERWDFTREKFGFSEYGYYGYHRNGSHMAERCKASAVVSLDGNRAMEYNPMKWITEQLEAQGIYSSSDESEQ